MVGCHKLPPEDNQRSHTNMVVDNSCCNLLEEEEIEYDWRFTFTLAEADLFHYHRDKKALLFVYVILKHMIKMSVQRKNHVVRTYHLKTLFFWIAEEVCSSSIIIEKIRLIFINLLPKQNKRSSKNVLLFLLLLYISFVGH